MCNRVKILYVDDEPLNLELFKLNLEHKYSILTAESAFEGFEVIQNNPDIKLVISDLMMPSMNGLDFILKLRERYTNLSYFILSGFDLSPEIIEAKQNNVISKYLFKPFDIALIEISINEALTKKA